MHSEEEVQEIVERWKEYFNGPPTPPVEFPDDPYFGSQRIPTGPSFFQMWQPRSVSITPRQPTVQVRVNAQLSEIVPIPPDYAKMKNWCAICIFWPFHVKKHMKII